MNSLDDVTQTKRLTIKRSLWARTDSNGDKPCGPSYLLNGDGAMCCLGWDCSVLHGPQVLRDKTVPYVAYLKSSFDKIVQSELVRINDRFGTDLWNLTDVEQEQRIIDIFAQHGITLTFED